MKITNYTFGRIEVDGHEYDSDVIITSEGVRDSWWRKEGHNLSIDDLQTVIEAEPEIVVIGSGRYGRMQVPQSTVDYLHDKGIRVEVAQTAEAVHLFNGLQKECARIVAALHLTC